MRKVLKRVDFSEVLETPSQVDSLRLAETLADTQLMTGSSEPMYVDRSRFGARFTHGLHQKKAVLEQMDWRKHKRTQLQHVLAHEDLTRRTRPNL